MAKQSGIHQLRGKVGDMSYYRQSGVSSGLVRSINSAISGRVKTSPEYANTRLNNEEFKTATCFAGSVLDAVVPRFRPMFNNFRNAKYSAEILRIIKSNTGAWGGREIGLFNRASVADAVAMIAKNPFSALATVSFNGYDSVEKTQNIEITAVDGFHSHMEAVGATGCDFKLYGVGIFEGNPVADRKPNVVQLTTSEVINFLVSDPLSDLTDNTDVKQPQNDLSIVDGRTFLPFYYVIALPYRMVGTTKYVLQEACTLTILPDPEYGG